MRLGNFLTTLVVTFAAFTVIPADAQFLGDRTHQIEAVVVSSNGEDRAYRIMRNAIARAPYHRDQVASYNAEVYLKGSVDVVKISRAMNTLGGKSFRQEVKQGDNHTQESVSEIDFTAPDRYRQRVIKQISNDPEGSGEAQNEAMRMVNFNIYNTQALPIIISPLSPGAFNHYRFVYEGYTEVGDRMINKIRVTPRRRSQELVEGYLYIAEDWWNVHEIDLSGHINMVAGVDFRLEANYGKVTPTVWMPVNYRMTFDLSLMGSHFAAKYVASAKYNKLVENKSVVAATTSQDPSQDLTTRQAYRVARRSTRELDNSRRQAPGDSLRRDPLDLTPEFVDKYKVSVDSLARTPDPAFWDRHRPEPLTPTELEGYRAREVAATAVKAESDSTDTTASPAKRSRSGESLFGKIVTGGGKPLKFGKHGGSISWRGIIPSREGFNTVDGYYLGWSPIRYNKIWHGVKATEATGGAGGSKGRGRVSLSVTPEVTWAIDRHVALATLTSRLSYAPARRGQLTITAGSISRDFNGSTGIRPFENTVASLFFRRNYMKLYQDNFVEAANVIELASGLKLSTGAKFARRLGLANHSDHSLFYSKQRVYTPNIAMPAHNSFTLSGELTYTPRLYYRMEGGRKVPVRSAWPTFFAGWRGGIDGVWGSDTKFNHISGGLRQKIDLGPGQEVNYLVRGGAFVGSSRLFFADYHHFSTDEIPVGITSITGGDTFKTLQYYRHSTAQRYVQAHASYNARFLFLKLLPWISNRLWREGVQVNYLCTPALKHYSELGYTIGLVWQAGVFVGFEGTRYQSWGFKFSLPIDFDSNGGKVSISL
jgi:hypothetical protein